MINYSGRRYESEESKVVKILRERLSEYNNEWFEEYKVRRFSKYWRIDLANPQLDVAIECKGDDELDIIKGIGQCLLYRNMGAKSYLAASKISMDICELCSAHNIPLIYVDTDRSTISLKTMKDEDNILTESTDSSLVEDNDITIPDEPSDGLTNLISR